MIREYIISHIKSKLVDHPSLVIYDSEQRYQELLTGLANDHIKIFDTSDSVLSVREDALDFYTNTIPSGKDKKMVLYVPFPAPQSKQDKILDPFYIFSFGGVVFPYDAGDKYESLCKACFKDKEQQINQLFQEEIPDFDTIDALGGGYTWAKLQTLTGGKSEKEILVELLAPGPTRLEALKKDKTWLKEYKELSKQIGLTTKEKSFDAVNDELWRFILFSEFVFDLPIPLPTNLASISIAKNSSKNLILDICQTIRNNKVCEDLYIEKADQIAEQLSLPELFKNENNLGDIITFSFEDNTYYYHLVDLIKEGKGEEASKIIAKSKNNIWYHHDEERRRYWKLAEVGLQLIQLTNDKAPTASSLHILIDNYTTVGYKVDQLQRKFEKLVVEVIQSNTAVSTLVELVRKQYRKFTEKLQKNYQLLFKDEHWPVDGVVHNNQVFNKFIQPLLNSNTKIAYILVDALRFELAKELEGLIEKHFSVELYASCAFLPTVTKYGMAALLPNAEKELHLDEHKGTLEAFMGTKPLLTLANRKEYLKEKLGDRCDIISLDNLISSLKVKAIDLLVITTNEIDAAGENLASNALVMMHQAIQNLVKGIFLLKQSGFNKIVIATDHGFVLHPSFLAGDNVSKPKGEWLMAKSRSLAGKGAASDYTLSFLPEQIGTKSTVEFFSFLRDFAVFEKNTTYFHEGVSLQENVVPVMVLTNQKARKQKKVEVNVTYKGKSGGFITTRRPLIEISSFIEGELGLEPVVIRVEALANGQIVGVAASDEKVNETTNLVEIMPGQACKIPIDMQPEFEGEFEIKLTDPVTSLTLASITLETDYIS
ncbi:PglZ domain-containing protein [Pontibacter toksunensis]|uniref:PglZ domain-containing protein n=1 Tax=Pontibacter toksunensis TaxID=1332631 RepID=A0ABW6BT43_9BACT